MVDCVGVPAKFKSTWHYALGGRGVFGRVWAGAAADGCTGAAAGRRGVFEEGAHASRSVGAHQPIGAAVADAQLLQAVESAQEVLPFQDEAGLAREIVEMLLHRKRQEGTKDMPADGGVGGMEDRPRAHDRLGSADKLLDLEKIAIAQHRLQRRDLGVGAQDEDFVEARLFGELAGVDLE